MSSTLKNLTATTAVKRTDLFYGLLDPSGTPLDRKATVSLVRPYYDFVQDFGGDPTGVADQGALIESALQTIADAGGGTLYFPSGVYLISRALQSTGTVNAQIRLPVISTNTPTTTAQVSIRIIGALPPPTSGESTVLPSSGHSVWKSTLTGASGTASVMASGNSGRNNLHLEVTCLILQLPPDPTLSGFNFGYQQDVIVQYVLIHTGSLKIIDVTQPTHSNNYGLIMPQAFMSALAVCRDCMIWGCYTGYKIGELSLADGMHAESCYHGIECPQTYHDVTVYHSGLYQCAYGVYAEGTEDIYIQFVALDFERTAGQYNSWQDPVADIYDPNDRLRGKATWHSSDSNASGFIGNTILVTGAFNFELQELGGPRYISTTPVFDTFVDSDGTALTSHTISPFNSASTSWTVLASGGGGSFTIESNHAKTALGSPALVAAKCNPGKADGTLGCVFNFVGAISADAGIIFRITDASNYWFVSLSQGTNRFSINERVSGSNFERMGQRFDCPTDTDMQVIVWMNGSRIRARVGGSTIEYYSSTLQTNTIHGFYTTLGAVTVDNWHMRAL